MTKKDRASRWTARLLIAALLTAMPGEHFYAYAASAVRVKVSGAAMSSHGPIGAVGSMPATFSAVPAPSAPVLGVPNLAAPSPALAAAPNAAIAQALIAPAAGAAATPAAIDNLISASVQLGSLQTPNAGDSMQKTEAGRSFDATAKAKNQDAPAVSGQTSAGTPSLSASSQRAAAATPAVARKTTAAAQTGWKAKAKKYMPAALLAAGTAGLAWGLQALGMPEAGAGILPLMMLGTLGAPTEGPSDAEVKRFHEKLQEKLEPGDLIGAKLEDEIANEIGIHSESAQAILLKLAASGRIAALNNGTYIYSDLAARTQSGNADSTVAAGDKLAYAGLNLLNASNIDDHARALHAFEKAMATYVQAEHATGQRPGARSQVNLIKQNAYLALLGDYLRAYDKALAERDQKDATVAQSRKLVREALAWVNKSYFSKTHFPEMLEADSHLWLMRIVNHLNPEKHVQKAHGQDIASGIKLLQSWAEGLGPEASEPEPAPRPVSKALALVPSAPVNDKGFPLIAKDDKNFKALNEYGTNITGAAVEGTLTPLIGRKAEIRQMVKTLLRVEKNNPIVIGDKGVGKTAIISGLAQMIVNGEIPELKGKNIIQLNLTKIVAGTKYRGEFEERMQNIMTEVKASKGQVILFIDEVHRILGAGSAEGGNDASQILKDSLSTGEMSVIGATTLTEYRKIEKDGALARRFNAVKLEPPSPEEAVAIVMGVKARYEKKHKVTISEQTVKDAVHNANRYITDRNLPDSVLDLIDDASAEVELRASESKDPKATREVTSQDVAFEIALRTGIPAGQVSTDDLALLQSLPEALTKRLVGQDPAIQAVVRAIRRGRMGYRDPKRPVGVFALLGPTGVGKTHLARTIARHLFRSEKNMVRIDMSEYMEKHAVSRLIGAPPGYVGHDGEGQLTEPVRRAPHSVVLFDEIEKAAPEVLDILLQILDDGFVTDSQGRRVDFSNTIIMLSSNIGGSLARAEDEETKRPRIGFITGDEQQAKKADTVDDEAARQANYLSAFKASVRPEFFNRIGKRNVVVFNRLGRPELESILEINVADLNERLKQKDMTITLTPRAKQYLLDDADRPENRNYGARPLNQTMENEVETALVDAELARTIRNGDKVVIDVKDGALTVSKQ